MPKKVSFVMTIAYCGGGQSQGIAMPKPYLKQPKRFRSHSTKSSVASTEPRPLQLSLKR